MEHLQHFGLTRDPFANEPVASLYFASAAHADAERRLTRGVSQRKGLCLLTGPAGCGKTMVARHFLESLEEEVYEACILVPIPGVSDGSWVLTRFAQQMGVEEPAEDPASLLAQVYEQLAIVREDGRSTVLIIDEAQVLVESGALGELRGLLNLEYEDRRLMTVYLAGLPSLEDALECETGLAERVDIRVRLDPLDERTAAQYLMQRIRGVGGNPAILESAAIESLIKYGAGIPRRLNSLADNALFEAYLAGRVSATAQDVESAAADLGFGVPSREAIEAEVEPAQEVPAEPEPVEPAPALPEAIPVAPMPSAAPQAEASPQPPEPAATPIFAPPTPDAALPVADVVATTEPEPQIAPAFPEPNPAATQIFVPEQPEPQPVIVQPPAAPPERQTATAVPASVPPEAQTVIAAPVPAPPEPRTVIAPPTSAPPEAPTVIAAPVSAPPAAPTVIAAPVSAPPEAPTVIAPPASIPPEAQTVIVTPTAEPAPVVAKPEPMAQTVIAPPPAPAAAPRPAAAAPAEPMAQTIISGPPAAPKPSFAQPAPGARPAPPAIDATPQDGTTPPGVAVAVPPTPQARPAAPARRGTPPAPRNVAPPVPQEPEVDEVFAAVTDPDVDPGFVEDAPTIVSSKPLADDGETQARIVVRSPTAASPVADPLNAAAPPPPHDPFGEDDLEDLFADNVDTD